MIIISSDHGDEFWEHGSCGHGQNLYQELINVPLVIKANGWFPKGGNARFGADGVDVLPTIQRVLGQPVAKDAQGLDLLGRVWSKGPVYPVANIASMGVKRYALKVGPAKIVMAGPGALSAYEPPMTRRKRKIFPEQPNHLARCARSIDGLYGPCEVVEERCT